MQKKTGTKELRENTYNFQLGCENGCRYCYARSMLVDQYHKCTNEQWLEPVINWDKVNKKQKFYNGGVMMPSSHDITPLNIDAYCTVLGKMLEFNNDVLITSKPRFACITKICEQFKDRKNMIEFLFTIGSTEDDILEFWEPNASNFTERIACLHYAYQKGYRTSVICEPYLDPYPVYTYTACQKYLTDSFWIGKLRHFNSRVRLDDATPEQIKKYVEPVKAASKDKVIKSIYRMLDGQPFIQWKDSIREVMGI